MTTNKWRVAKSLDKLLSQLNILFPTRSKVSDGSIGDAAHASRNSDHNPWIKVAGEGVVTARDFTNDVNTLSGEKLLTALLKSKDPRIKYVIFDKKIYNSKDGFKPRAYTGINAHQHHLHLSVSSDPNLFDNNNDWNLTFDQVITPVEAPKPEPVNSTKLDTTLVLKLNDKGNNVKVLQQKLVKLKLLGNKDIDSDFGPKTELAVKVFQLNNKLTNDGIVGKKTIEKLNLIV